MKGGYISFLLAIVRINTLASNRALVESIKAVDIDGILQVTLTDNNAMNDSD